MSPLGVRHLNRTILAVFLAIASAVHAEDEQSRNLQAMRAKYDADTAAATKPIRERYVGQLEIAKKSAIARGDLKTANAIDAEIQRLASPRSVLIGHLWTSRNLNDAWEFSADGTLIQHRKGWAGKSWKMSEDEKSVEFTYFNGVKATYGFKDGVLIHPDPEWGAFLKAPKK